LWHQDGQWISALLFFTKISIISIYYIEKQVLASYVQYKGANKNKKGNKVETNLAGLT